MYLLFFTTNYLFYKNLESAIDNLTKIILPI